MLIEFSEVKQFLADSLTGSAGTRLPSLGLVHGPQVLDLALRDFQLRRQMLYAVVHLLLGRANDADNVSCRCGHRPPFS